MLKLLLFYFLFFSLPFYAQNSFQSTFEKQRNLPIFSKNDPHTFSERNLVILDKNYSDKNSNQWLINPLMPNNNEPSSDFSSLLLKKQLEELNHITPFEISHNPTLERFIRVYLNDRKESISKLMDRATYYFPIFEAYLDKYNLPLEIKYLAVIESALKPNATSKSGAKGLWQFMLTTGKQFDLQVNSYVDDRFDPLKSTEAACKYLSSLYTMFNDWDLALAAYNSGPGNVRKAIKRAGGKRNYWEIRQFLPQETRGYLPAFYATYYIFEYAKTHQLEPTNSALTYYEIDTIHVKKQITFASIQKNIPIKKELLIALNPQYKREIIPYSKNQKYVLTLPKNLTTIFIENENEIYQSSQTKSHQTQRIEITKNNSYIVEKGDNLNKIAAKYSISLEQLKLWNGLQTDYLITKQRLVITNKKQKQHAIK
ncbi:MAG: transglycosylase SLT domain-containing protein [Flavobacteriaceae bacterium]|nr:transglycosylase SLT domain-containing protein [Flavobacteriaceae bacterium]